MRALSETQASNSKAVQTKPIVLVRHEHSGIEELAGASGGSVVFNGETYATGPSGVKVLSIVDSRLATLWLSPTNARLSEVVNGTWRNGSCTIYLIPALPGELGPFVLGDQIQPIEGKIISSKYSSSGVVFQVQHSTLTSVYTPPNKCDEVANHIPAPGTVLTWDGEKTKLERKK